MTKAPPEHVLTNAKTGLRVGIGLLALSLIQFNVRGPANNPSSGAYNWLHTAVQWASVTLVLIQMPETLGGSVWLSLQRILGTLDGGWVAFGLVVGVSNGVALAFCGMAVAMLAAFTKVGQFNRFGGFVVITWCIVAMQGFYYDSTSMLLLQAGVRVIGIIVGVLIGLAASILILPDSAFGQAVQITHGTLAASITLHELAWQNLKPKAADPKEIVVIRKSSKSDCTRVDTHDEKTTGNGDVEGRQNSAPGSHLQQCWHWISGNVKAATHSLTERVGSSRASAEDVGSTEGTTLAFDQALWDEELNKCSVGLTSYRAAIADAASELYVGTDCLGHRWFLPTLKWPQLLTWAMPKDELKATRTAARKLRQSVYGIHHLLLEGFDFNLLQVAQQRQMLEEVGATSKAALAACLDAFPGADLAVTDWPAAAVMRAALDAIDALVQHAALASPEMLAHLAEQRRQQPPPSPRKSAIAAAGAAVPPCKSGGVTPQHESGSTGRAPAAHSLSSSNDGSSMGVGDVPVRESWAANSQRLLQAARHSGSLHSRRASGSGGRQCTSAASTTGAAAAAMPHESPTAVPSSQCTAAWPRGQQQDCHTLQQTHGSHGLHASEARIGRSSNPRAADQEGSRAELHPAVPDPQQLEAYIAQVRWNGLIVGVVALADAMVSVLHSVNALLPLLPGSLLRRQQAPDTVELQEWPSCFAVWGILHSSFQNEPSVAAEERSASAGHQPTNPGLGL